MTRFTPAVLALLLAGTLTAAADEAGGMKDKAAAATPDFDIAFGGWGASDYVFRGISQSDRWPSVSSYTELRYTIKPMVLYAGTSGESIDFPNHAGAEVDFYAGVRPTFDKLSLDFGFWYYWYPGGQLFDGLGPIGPNPNCTNRFKFPGGCNVDQADLSFWEVYGKTTYAIDDTFTVGGDVFYSPSWENEGAYGTYASLTGKAVLPESWLSSFAPKGVGAFVSGEFGHYWFGRANAFYANVDYPDYNTWNAGISFTYKIFTLDFRYYDTDLTRANCNVLEDDHTASFSLSNVTSINPSGLGSDWCGAAFVAKASFDLTVNTNLK